jgi:hypothetical protein
LEQLVQFVAVTLQVAHIVVLQGKHESLDKTISWYPTKRKNFLIIE